MTPRYTLSTQARQDLKDIKDYIAQDSLDRAEQFVKSIAERFQVLASFPGMGRRYEMLSADLRGFSVGNYILGTTSFSTAQRSRAFPLNVFSADTVTWRYCFLNRTIFKKCLQVLSLGMGFLVCRGWRLLT
jgi:plasmid stabilization system protein ParE